MGAGSRIALTAQPPAARRLSTAEKESILRARQRDRLGLGRLAGICRWALDDLEGAAPPRPLPTPAIGSETYQPAHPQSPAEGLVPSSSAQTGGCHYEISRRRFCHSDSQVAENPLHRRISTPIRS